MAGLESPAELQAERTKTALASRKKKERIIVRRKDRDKVSEEVNEAA